LLNWNAEDSSVHRFRSRGVGISNRVNHMILEPTDGQLYYQRVDSPAVNPSIMTFTIGGERLVLDYDAWSAGRNWIERREEELLRRWSESGFFSYSSASGFRIADADTASQNFTVTEANIDKYIAAIDAYDTEAKPKKPSNFLKTIKIKL
jgi:hypothetical protein